MKHAIVTGATSGIGKAIAIRLASEGYEVIGIGRNAERGNQLNEIDNVTFKPLDVSNPESVQHYFEELKLSKVTIDALVNVAGVEDDLKDPLDTQTWEHMFKTNLYGAVECVRGALTIMESGVVVNISSVTGGSKVTFSHRGLAYQAAKAALHKVTESIAVTNAPHIRAITISPGYTRTPMWDTFTEQEQQECIDDVPIKRFIEAEEVAGIVSHVIENKAFNGVDIVIDGGLGLRRIE